MKATSLNCRTALVLSAAISLLMNLLFLVMFVYGRDAVMPEDVDRARKTLRLGNMLMHILANFLVAFTLYMLNFWLLKVNLSAERKWLLIVGLTIVGTAVVSYLISSLQLQFQNFGPHPERFIRGGMFRDSFIAVMVVLSSQVLYLSQKQQQTALENESLLAENMRTRFTALKNQVDPHFLFNSLNTLNSLIKVDTGKAQEYVQQLSYVFRYTLQSKEIITLEEELKYTKAYCNLMQIRYGESLQFMFDINEEHNLCSVVPLCLQTLVENAIKHNVVSNRQPLTITIATHGNETISVANAVQLKKEPESGEGIGLSNLAERYRLMWEKEIMINRVGDRFEVIIPLIKR
ncbi:MAG: histidine kinase [Prevotellaceae bacterium]|jgi:sensor histidine kinase YesM|nr:histidine kinase [Prevotellaceae bacterium]